MQIVIDIDENLYTRLFDNGAVDAVDMLKACVAIRKGTPIQEMPEIKNEIEDLSKRVETLEKQIKEDKEEQLKKLEAELDYAKFRCALPTIMTDMMQHN